MATLTEARRTGEFIISEANGTRSRDVVIIAAAAGAMVAGTVLSKLTADGKYVAYDDSGSDGTETAFAILFAPIGDSASDQTAVVIARDAEVDEALLTGINAGGKVDLAAVGIIVR